ncbi:MAG TPA: hypothetical protein VK797_07005 [Tepidisphaeraceae bacterium]|jgi:hypothetical protein|nr:hypothetical protein [Tepidisphaeraceae bacterium]
MEAAKRLIEPSEDDWLTAWEAYARGEAADAGIVDHVSFIVMRKMGITDAFTTTAIFKPPGLTPCSDGSPSGTHFWRCFPSLLELHGRPGSLKKWGRSG